MMRRSAQAMTSMVCDLLLVFRPSPDAEALVDKDEDKDEAAAEPETESIEEDAPKAKKKSGRKKTVTPEASHLEARKPVPGWIQAQVSIQSHSELDAHG